VFDGVELKLREKNIIEKSRSFTRLSPNRQYMSLACKQHDRISFPDPRRKTEEEDY